MQSVLVCVRTSSAAQAVTNAAARLGLGEIITTAISGADALTRVAAAPPDVVLVDTASVRPDTVSFTRRVLERSPRATVVFFGPEDSNIAERAVAAGARGLIRGGEREELVASVAKALMLLLRPVRPAVGNGPAVEAAMALQAVPLQRSEIEEEEADGVLGGASADGSAGLGSAVGSGAVGSGSVGSGAVGSGSGGSGSGGAGSVGAGSVGAGSDVGSGDGGATVGIADGGVGVADVRRLALTERELQVLGGMADGKSNAEIGRELFVSEDTVKTHARRLFRKLGARDRAHAVAAAFRAGIVT